MQKARRGLHIGPLSPCTVQCAPIRFKYVCHVTVEVCHDLYKHVQSQKFYLFHANSTDLDVEPDSSLLSWATAVLLQPKQVAVDIPDIALTKSREKPNSRKIHGMQLTTTHAGSTIKCIPLRRGPAFDQTPSPFLR